jgi:F-type H+-transporting ATPase subunit epsilon
MNTLKVWIQTPQETLFFEDIQEARLPGTDGIVGILPNHAPMIIGLKAGIVHLSRRDSYSIHPGIASITKEGCLIITEQYETLIRT